MERGCIKTDWFKQYTDTSRQYIIVHSSLEQRRRTKQNTRDKTKFILFIKHSKNIKYVIKLFNEIQNKHNNNVVILVKN